MFAYSLVQAHSGHIKVDQLVTLDDPDGEMVFPKHCMGLVFFLLLVFVLHFDLCFAVWSLLRKKCKLEGLFLSG